MLKNEWQPAKRNPFVYILFLEAFSRKQFILPLMLVKKVNDNSTHIIQNKLAKCISTLFGYSLRKLKFLVLETTTFFKAFLLSQLLTAGDRADLICNQGRNEVCGIRDQGPKKKGGIRDHSPGIWDHNPRDWDQRCFSLDQGSGVLDQQNFAGQGIKNSHHVWNHR